ncbi:hypothetical protein [Streptomyces jeddahensis]|uniref:Gram-positive cocci surface proteins LPxTG domain-containing protein n=1 Tax=Streptomyces jeddahensis TaxID=1716141 RepID=A0A177HRW3_9ACTN|nr:hypothetical protein [Streptomyces jeddahensis]OAH13390.1 hypothetical protein STSP_32790 [Streptomyces jeddahensis]
MRLCRSLASGGRAATAALAATAVMLTPATTLTLLSASPVAAATNDSSVALQPTCATANSGDFPIDTRIHGGPATYQAGGGRQEWLIDLTNTTGESCGNIHPVVVLVDERRSLQPGQVRLEFEDSTRQRAVTFEHTDADENVGVFGDDFAGFTVAPGATVTVKVRLSFTADAQPGGVVANAAIVQRQDDDGDWVGESNDYAFTIDPALETPSPSPSTAHPDPSPSTATPDPDSSPSAREPQGKEKDVDDELAGTGRRQRALITLGVTAGALLLGGIALVLTVRSVVRLRRR